MSSGISTRTRAIAARVEHPVADEVERRAAESGQSVSATAAALLRVAISQAPPLSAVSA